MAGNHLVIDHVRRIFADVLKIHVASEDTDVIEAGLIDSLALVELLFQIERDFKIRLPLDEFEIDSFRTLRSIGDFISSQVAS